MVTGHDDKREQRVPLTRKMQKCVLDNFRLPLVRQVSDGTLLIEQFVDQCEHQLVLAFFPLTFRKLSWSRTRIQLLAVLSNPF